LEVADREFQSVQEEDKRLREDARQKIKEGSIDQVEITPDALRTFLSKALGADQRISWDSYDYMARVLRACGFKNLRQVEKCIAGYDDDKLSRLAFGNRQGQALRFELMVIAGMGERYTELHLWSQENWFKQRMREDLASFRANGIHVKAFDPNDE